MLRRALLAGMLLGAIAALTLIHRDALRLTTAWPVILGFALWESVGERGSRGIITALAVGGGCTACYGVFFIVSEFLPITDLNLGIMSGLAVAVLVIIALMSRGWITVAAPMIGFAAFFGVFEPQWRQSASNFRSHGLDVGSVVGLGLVIGILSATVVRWLTEMTRARAAARERPRQVTANQDSDRTITIDEMLEAEGGSR